MINDLEHFSVERLEQLASGKYVGTGLGCKQAEGVILARIALAVKTAKPVAEIKCHEDLSLSVVNVADGFSLGRHPVYEFPLSSKEPSND